MFCIASGQHKATRFVLALGSVLSFVENQLWLHGFSFKGIEWHEQRNDGVRFAEKEKIKDMSLLHQIQLRLLSKNLWNWCLLMGYGEIRNKIELLLHSIYLKNILKSESHYGIRMKEHYISQIIGKRLS